MATILNFRSQSARHESGARTLRTTPAEIVIFPGVRYERWVDAEPDKQPAVRRRRRDEITFDY